eukprot:756624-Hanusia_phi.AAC.1
MRGRRAKVETLRGECERARQHNGGDRGGGRGGGRRRCDKGREERKEDGLKTRTRAKEGPDVRHEHGLHPVEMLQQRVAANDHLLGDGGPIPAGMRHDFLPTDFPFHRRTRGSRETHRFLCHGLLLQARSDGVCTSTTILLLLLLHQQPVVHLLPVVLGVQLHPEGGGKRENKVVGYADLNPQRLGKAQAGDLPGGVCLGSFSLLLSSPQHEDPLHARRILKVPTYPLPHVVNFRLAELAAGQEQLLQLDFRQNAIGRRLQQLNSPTGKLSPSPPPHFLLTSLPAGSGPRAATPRGPDRTRPPVRIAGGQGG